MTRSRSFDAYDYDRNRSGGKRGRSNSPYDARSRRGDDRREDRDFSNSRRADDRLDGEMQSKGPRDRRDGDYASLPPRQDYGDYRRGYDDTRDRRDSRDRRRSSPRDQRRLPSPRDSRSTYDARDRRAPSPRDAWDRSRSPRSDRRDYFVGKDRGDRRDPSPRNDEPRRSGNPSVVSTSTARIPPTASSNHSFPASASAPPSALPQIQAPLGLGVMPPSSATDLVDWQDPSQVYNALCMSDEVLPPGWERVVFKGAVVYLDHLTREAYEEKPWEVWARKARANTR